MLKVKFRIRDWDYLELYGSCVEEAHVDVGAMTISDRVLESKMRRRERRVVNWAVQGGMDLLETAEA